MTSVDVVDVKRLFLFVRDATFCQRSDAVLAFVRQTLSSQASTTTSLGSDALLLCAETQTDAAPLLLLSDSDVQQIGQLTDFTVSLTLPARAAPSLRQQLRMCADSELVVLTAAYRIVVSLDVSPSVASIDHDCNEVLFDALLRACERTAFALLDVFRLDSAGAFTLEFRPRLYASFVAQMGLADTFWPLVQCALLTPESIADVLVAVRRRLERTESRAASRALRLARHASANADLSATIQNAAFVLKLMPEAARSLIVLICDGAVALPDTSAYDNLLMLLNREAISCSSVQIGAGFAPSGAFGYVPDCDVLRHLASATHGCFFTARRLAVFCNRDTHPAYAEYVSAHTGLGTSAQSRYVDPDHVLLQKWRGDASGTLAADATLPGNVLQQRLLWNAFSPARRYFAYNDAYRLNGAGIGSQLDGPLLSSLPRHPIFFASSSATSSAHKLHAASSAPERVPSFAELRSFLPVEDADAPPPPPCAVVAPLVGNTSIDAEIVVPSAGGLNRLICVHHPFPWCDPPPPVPLQRESLRLYELNCSVATVADVRLREGFLVDDMQRANRLMLLLPWIANVIIGYSVIAKKDADIHTAPVRVELSVYACDEFLNEFAFARANPQAPSATPPPVRSLVTFVAELLQTDRLLQQLCTRVGVGPAVSSALAKDAARSMQAEGARRRVARTLWRTLASLAAMSWHRWLRIERLELQLSPTLDALRPADYSPFAQRAQAGGAPGDLLVADVTALNVGFARANELLLRFCAQWATFVHSPKLFARFVAGDGTPIAADAAVQLRSFCVLRLQSDGDQLGLLSAQFAMYGLSPAGRQRVLSDFAAGLQQLAATETEALAARIDMGDADGAAALQVALDPVLLALVRASRRAVTPLLVRYAPISLPQAAAAAAAAAGDVALHPLALLRPTVALLEAHMHWRRRVWRVRDPFIRALVVDTLIHERMRDGMQLCGAGGVFTLARSLQMTVDRHATDSVSLARSTMPSMLQYVVFAAAPDLIATEVWMEPQHGALVGGQPAARRSAGVRLFNDIERAFYEADRELVWALVTFDVVMLTIQSGHLSRAEQVDLLQQQTAQVNSAELSSRGLQVEPAPVSLGALVRCASATVSEYESMRRPFAASVLSGDDASVAANLVQLRNLVELHDSGELKDVVVPAAAGAATATATAATAAAAATAATAAAAAAATTTSAPLSMSQSERLPAPRRPTLGGLAGAAATTSTAVLPLSSAVAAGAKRGEMSRFSSTAHHASSQRATHKSPAASIGIVGKAPAIDPRTWSSKMLRAALHRLLCRTAAASNLVLWGAFGQFVAFASDCEMPPHSVGMQHASKELAPFAGARCFATRVGACTVMIAFLARVPDADLELASQRNDGERASPLRLHAFECSRDQLVVSHVLTPPRLPFLRDGAGAGVPPFVPPSRFSAQGELFLRNLATGFERCFARTVYTQLRRGHATGADDVARALRICSAYATEVDITQYLRVQHKHFADEKADESRVHKRADDARAGFRAATLEHFRPLADFVLPQSGAEAFADVWVYAPSAQRQQTFRRSTRASFDADSDVVPEAGDLGASGSMPQLAASDVIGDVLDGEWAADVNERGDAGEAAPVHIDRQTASGAWPMPLFVRFERVLRGGGAPTAAGVPMTDIPTALDDAVLGQPFDHAAIRIIALTLPPFEPLMPQANGGGGGGGESPAPDGALPSCQLLPNSMQAALKAFTDGINSFLSSQILDVLRFRRPLSSAILDMAQFHMARMGAKCVEFSVPLHFLSPADGLALFPSQLTSSFYLTLRKIGDLYCVVEPRANAGDSANASRSSTPPPAAAATPSSAPPALAGRQSLHTSWAKPGSVMSPAIASRRSVLVSPGSPDVLPPSLMAAAATAGGASAAVSAAADDDAYEIPFWLLMRINEQEVHFSFVGPDSLSSIERSRFCTDLRAGARRVCERVNQLYLLAQVHEMRTSSNLQILSIDKRELRKAQRRREQAAVEESAPDAAVVGTADKRSIFFPGQFVCPQVYAIQLPLHPRLAPDVAMRALIEAALHPFSVTNRKNVFVYREQNGNVFYLELSERAPAAATKARRVRSGTTSAASSRPTTPPVDDGGGGGSGERRPSDVSAASVAAAWFDESDDDDADELEESDTIAIVSSAPEQLPLTASPAPTIEGGESAAQQQLVLRVFGVEQPTAEITVQMRDLLHAKLSEITLKLMSSLLARNPNLRMTVDDVRFLMGVDAHLKQASEPAASSEAARVPCRVRIGVPSAVDGLGLWLAFVRAHLMHRQFLTTANAPRSAFFDSKRRAELATVSPPGAVRQRLFSDSGNVSGASAPTSGVVLLQQHTQPLLFNHVAVPGAARLPPNRVRSYGDGVALVYLRVRDDDGALVTRVECNEREQRMWANQFDAVGDAPMFAPARLRGAVDGALRGLRVECEFGAPMATDDVEDDAGGVTHRYSASCKHHWLVLDIWQRGHVNIEAIARGVSEQVRNAIVAYVFETHLVAPQPSLCTPFWVRAAQQLAARAVETANDAFSDFDAPLALPTHAIVPFARDVATRLCDVLPHLQASIYRLPPPSLDGVADDRALAPLGVAEMAQWRAESWCDAADLPRLLITTTTAAPSGSASPDETLYESIKLDTNAPFHRRQFAVVCVARERLRVVTYNLKPERNAALREAFNSLARWVGMRRAALDSILLQKLGLAHALRSDLLGDAIDPDAHVPSVEPLLIFSAPTASAVAAVAAAAAAVSAVAPTPVETPAPIVSSNSAGSSGAGGSSSTTSTASTASGGSSGGAGAGNSGSSAVGGGSATTASDEKKPAANNDNSQMISDLIAIGGSAVRRVSSRHDTVAAAMAARRRGVAFGPPRGGGVASPSGVDKAASAVASVAAASAAVAEPPDAPPPSTALAASQSAQPERSGLAALLFHDLLLREELLGVAVPRMRVSTLIDPVQRHGSQFLKLAAMAAQRCDSQREVLRALSRLNRVGHGDRLGRADLQRLLRSSRRVECASAPTPSAAAASTTKYAREVGTVSAEAAAWNELARVGPASEEATLATLAASDSADIGWSTTQANRIADLITKLLADRHGLRVLTLTSRTQSEAVVGVANVASERWLTRSFGKRAAFLAHLSWTSAAVTLHTYLADSLLSMPSRAANADVDRERAALTDDAVHISLPTFLRSAMWDFAAHELRDVIEARERAQLTIPPHEFVRLLQRHVDAAASRPSALSAAGALLWLPGGKRPFVSAPVGARSLVAVRRCAAIDGGVAADDVLAYLSRRGAATQLRSLAPLGISNAVALVVSGETAAQLPSTHDWSVLAAVASGESATRLVLVLLCTPRSAVELGAGADLSSVKLGAARRELGMADACALCLDDAQASLQTMVQSATADYQRDRLWSLMTEPQQRRAAELTLADFANVPTMLHAVDLARPSAAAAAASAPAEPRSLLRLGGHELLDQLLRSAAMRPWRDVMVLASQRFGTVRKDGTVRRTCLFLANQPQPQLVVFDTACPESLLLLSAGPATAAAARGAAQVASAAPDLASALAQQRTAIDGARLSMCFRSAAASPSDAEKQLANDFVQYLLACLWLRLAGRSIDAAAAESAAAAAAAVDAHKQ
jgi:hypothetical protein